MIDKSTQGDEFVTVPPKRKRKKEVTAKPVYEKPKKELKEKTRKIKASETKENIEENITKKTAASEKPKKMPPKKQAAPTVGPGPYIFDTTVPLNGSWAIVLDSWNNQFVLFKNLIFPVAQLLLGDHSL